MLILKQKALVACYEGGLMAQIRKHHLYLENYVDLQTNISKSWSEFSIWEKSSIILHFQNKVIFFLRISQAIN